MDDTRFRVDIEFCPVLGIRQAGHAADNRDPAIGTDIAEHAGLGPQRRIRRLAHNHDLAALAVIDIGIARRRPFDRGAGHVAEPAERGQLRVVAVLRPHRHGIIWQAQDIDCGNGAEQRVGIGQGMRNRLHGTVMVAAHPDHGIGGSRRLDVRRLKKTLEEAEQIAAVSLGPSNFHQI